jgi:RHS repeat-associated protein
MARVKSPSLFLISVLTASVVTAFSPLRQVAVAEQAPPSARCTPVPAQRPVPTDVEAPAPRRLAESASATGPYAALLTPERMIPGDEYTVAVTVTNTTARVLPKADYVVSYRWTLPDGTDQTRPDNRAETALSSDLTPGQSVTVDATVKAPTPVDLGPQRRTFVLNWDLRNRKTNRYLSESDGVTALRQNVTAELPTSDQLGLEKFYQYDGIAAGSGWSAQVNEFSGNAVVGYNALANPNRGPAAFVRLNYNSLDDTNSYLGQGWSLSTSSLPRLGSPLQFHVPLLGNPDYPTKVTLIDGDGTTHLFELNKNGSSDKSKWTYDSPAGVHLFLQRTGSDDEDRAWVMTRPDRTRMFFDRSGYQTATADRNGNELRFGYLRTDWGNRNTGVLTDITDASDRRVLTLDYNLPGDDYSFFSGDVKVSAHNLTNTSIIHQLRSITDVSGRTIAFTYDENGRLREIVDGTGTSGQKTFAFFYSGGQLARINDALGHGTQLTYADHRVRQLVDRRGNTTSFQYVDGTTKTTDPNGHVATATIDGFGRPVKLTDAKNEVTELAWDDDNNVRLLKEHNGAISTWSYDKKTGYPLEIKDAEANAHDTAPTRLGYRTSLDGHVADLTEKTSPEGRKWTFGIDDKGNLTSVTDPKGNAARNTYDQFGQLTASTDANGHTTRFADYDPSGSPSRIVDALDCTTTMRFDVVGNVVSTTDARGKTSTFAYDIFKRPLRTQVSKNAAADQYIITPGPVYDQNDNVVQSTAPNGAVSAAAYDANDQIVAVVTPKDNPTDTGVRRTTYQYDANGNPVKQTSPTGDTVTTTYDELNQLVSTTDPTGASATYEYDGVGDLVRAVDPLGHATQYRYDLDHRTTKVVDAAGFGTEGRYDGDGNVIATKDQDGNETLISYDERGTVREVKVPHADGVYRTTQYVYDAVGNRTKTITPRGVETTDDPDDFVQETVYDELNRVREQLTPYDRDDERVKTPDRTIYSYDEVGRLTEVSAPPSAGQTVRNVTRTSYFDNGWVRDSTDPWDVRTSFDYDALGNQVSRGIEARDKSPVRTMTWDYYPDGKLKARGDDGVPVGRDTLVVDNSDPATEFTGDWGTAGPSEGHEGFDYRLHSAGSGDDHVTWNIDVPRNGTYEVFVRYTDAATATDATYTVEHDGGVDTKPVDQTQRVGEWVSLGSHAYTEDQVKKITLTDNANGTVVADAVKLVRDGTGEVDNEQKTFGYAYDLNNNMTAMTDSSPGTVVDNYVLAYTSRSEVAQIQEKQGGTVKATTAYTYDAVGNPLTRTHNAQTSTYEYSDPRNLLTKVTNTDTGTTPQVTSYTYDNRALTSTETKANGNVVSNDEYFLDGLLRHSVERKPNGTVVDEHRLEYDVDGQRVKDTSHKMNADDNSAYLDNVASYTYDPRDRIRSVTKSLGEDESYVHDANNNVISQTVGGVATAFTYDRNRLVTSKTGGVTATSTYDPYGRLDKVTASGTLVEKYRYDGFDRVAEHQQLKAGSSTERVTIRNTYDPMDRTVTRTEGDERTDFAYLGLSTEVLNEAVDGQLRKSYQYSPTGERLSQTTHNDDGTTENAFYGYNSHTDVEQVTDSTGDTKSTYGYTAYGNNDKNLFTGIDKPDPQDPTRDVYNAYRFNAKRFDHVTGNYDMGFRDYSPGRNSFLTRDAYNGALDDLGLGLDPWTGSRYAFTGGNPVSRVEIDGHCAVDEGTLIGCATLQGEARYEREQQVADQWEDQQAAAQARKDWIANNSPKTNDRDDLLGWFYAFPVSPLLSGSGGGPFWSPQVGEDGKPSNVCFGRTACARAYNYLLANPNDIAGAKEIAATYCVRNFDQCQSDAASYESQVSLAEEFPYLLALGLAGGGPKVRGAAPEAAAEAPVGQALRSVDDVMANPSLLRGMTPAEVEPILGRTPGWRIEALGRGSHAGQGWVLRQYTEQGNPTGLQLRWHPGGGHHGPEPYWRVVGPNGDLGGIIR